MTCALSLSSSQVFQQAKAEESKSLIESALDGNYQESEKSAARTGSAPALRGLPAAKTETSTKANTEAAKASAEAAKASAEAAKASAELAKANAKFEKASAEAAKKTAAKTKKQSAQQSENSSANASSSESKKPQVVFSEPKWVEKDIPAPKDEMLASPIHSEIPAYHKTLLKVPMGVKVGKSYSIDPTYRGKPALPETQTVTFGAPSWKVPGKKQVATLPSAALPSPAINAGANSLNGTAPAASGNVIPSPAPNFRTAASSNSAVKNIAPTTLNIRIQTPQKLSSTDAVWAYPYPPKPPKPAQLSPLTENGKALRNQILLHGYSARPDVDRPYPPGGWRWVHAFQTGVKKSGSGYPHTMLTMYRWVDKVFPYVLSECHEMNLIEEKRSQRYEQVMADYERVHADLEAQATSKNLVPIEIKVGPRGIAQQTQLPAGNWWLAATRKQPGLKFYWQVPLTCNGNNETMNVQMTETNALIIAGGW